VLLGCGGAEPEPAAPSRPAAVAPPAPAAPAATPAAPEASPPAYALVVHGGAGALPRDLDPAVRRAYVASLAGALRAGCAALDGGASSLDVVEQAVRALEDDPLFNAGRGAVLTREGTHELDASLMRGRDHACGAVASVRTIRNPIAAARAVMEHTPHVLLVGEGAEAFAREHGMEPVDNAWFTTERRRRRWEARHAADEHGTVGAVALDRRGHLAAGTSTGGLSDKRWGRVGDSPIVGAGTYADDATCAVSCTGTGEEFIRHGVARAVSARMALAGESVTEAAEHLIHETLREGDGGLIALSHTGEVAMPHSTGGMFRGRCGPDGALEVRIWEDPEPLPAVRAGATAD
jgi:beta-aspartyl-peptidase (threonine type)